MLVVKPNPRRMRYMRDSDSREDLADPPRGGIASRIRWERVAAVAIGGAALLALIVVALHS